MLLHITVSAATSPAVPAKPVECYADGSLVEYATESPHAEAVNGL